MVVAQINQLLDQGINICIIGKYGYGKTYWLKQIKKSREKTYYFNNVSKETLSKLLKCNASKTELFDKLKKVQKVTLLFDDFQEYKKNDREQIMKLCEHHHIVIASNTILPRTNYLFKLVFLKKLSMEQCRSICTNKGLKNEKVINLICEKSGGNPLLIVRGIEHYKVTGVVKTYFVKNWKKALFAKLILFAYLCLSLRYIASLNKQWELYSLLSSIAYLILALKRSKLLK